MSQFKHDYQDESRHGSPFWVCKWCDRLKDDIKRSGDPDFCPKAEEGLAREAQRQESAERAEYQRMKAERQRWAYLHSKYGGEG